MHLLEWYSSLLSHQIYFLTKIVWLHSPADILEQTIASPFTQRNNDYYKLVETTKEKRTAITFNTLPEEVISLILSYLPYRQLVMYYIDLSIVFLNSP